MHLVDNGGENVIVYNYVIMYKLHECNQLPLQLLQKKIAITEKSVINYSQLQLLITNNIGLV